MELLAQAFANGLLIGGIYASFAIGFSLVFGVLRIVNIIHGEFIMLGAFGSYWLYKLWGIDPFQSIPIVFAALFVFGYLLQKTFINKIIDAPEVMSLLLTFGLSLIIANMALMAWGGDYRMVNPPYAGANFELGQLIIPYIRLATFIFALLAVGGLYLFLQHTSIGQAIRATAQNKAGARLQGVNPTFIYAITFGIGAGVTGIAGCLLSMSFSIFPSMGADYLLFSFFIVVLGGMGYIPGALVGGLILGVLQSLITTYLNAGLTYIIMFVILYIVLVMRPSGLFGKGVVE